MFDMKLSINGQEYEFENGKNALDIAGEISKDLKKTALAARINGRVISLPEAINEDGVLEILDFSDADGRKVMRHTASHVLAQAVKKLRPEVKLAIGPAIDNGFYYDFDVDMPFTPEFLKEVEKEMARIIKKNERLERFELPRAEALELMKDEPYKVELINDLPEDAVISFYRQGEFTDLCAGPHLSSTAAVRAFRLTVLYGRLLGGKLQKQDAPENLRHRLPLQGGTERLLREAGRGQETGSQQVGPRTGILHHIGCDRTGPADPAAQRRHGGADSAAVGGG